ncbi:cell division protein ZapA [bacterium]|nr:cell division protein ZapA [bacterium]MBU1937375.1 cell division protein ZapA [bacterium]
MDDREKTVHVTIFEQECSVKGDADADYVRRVAEFVDARMRAGRAAQPSKPPLKIAIITALNLADELLACQRDKEELISRFEEKAREFSDSLNRGLT